MLEAILGDGAGIVRRDHRSREPDPGKHVHRQDLLHGDRRIAVDVGRAEETRAGEVRIGLAERAPLDDDAALQDEVIAAPPADVGFDAAHGGGAQVHLEELARVGLGQVVLLQVELVAQARVEAVHLEQRLAAPQRRLPFATGHPVDGSFRTQGGIDADDPRLASERGDVQVLVEDLRRADALRERHAQIERRPWRHAQRGARQHLRIRQRRVPIDAHARQQLPAWPHRPFVLHEHADLVVPEVQGAAIARLPILQPFGRHLHDRR